MQSVKSEFQIEKDLMQQLKELGYKERIDINNITKIELNIKSHLERLNRIELEDKSIPNDLFESYVIRKIKNNTIFENAKLFRDKILIHKTSANDKNWRLKCFDKENLENNVFEYSHQVKQDSRLGNIGDVTLFLNGFPIVQIELKRSSVELTEAFLQIQRYKRQAFDENIFKITQLFVVSNEMYTKYFSNNSKINKNFMFHWSDENNNAFNRIAEFANSFLNKEVLFKMLTDYMVLNSREEIIALRPYQFHAVESVLKHIQETNQLNREILDLDERQEKLNGYIWHATGSGKTLTSFKVAQLLNKKSKIEKVIFLVDRLDLNDQSIKEFKIFLGDDKEDLEETENCSKLEKQLLDPTKGLIITTIQKLDRLLKRNNGSFITNNKSLIEKDLVFIIDECHRSQFGDMHKTFKRYFKFSRFIGFTGTPIFAENHKDGNTTNNIFGKALHKYMMMNAIKDNNVLKFNIEYLKGPKNKLETSNDIEVQAIDIDGYFSSDEYISKVVDYIYRINPIKTNNYTFKSMLVCSSVETAIKYYWKFREEKYSDFKVATLFSKIDNNQKFDDDSEEGNFKNVREELDKIIQDYNNVYGTNFSEKDFKTYSRDIQNKLSSPSMNIHMVIVVRMLTTGFNAKGINTVYLDRRLKGYEIIQTISRANRISENSAKSIANVVSLQTFKKDIDDAITLYNDTDSSDVILVKESLEELVYKINGYIQEIKNRWPRYQDIQNENSEVSIIEFIKSMKKINKLLLFARNYINYNDDLISWTRQEIEDYCSIQKEIRTRVENNIFKEPILKDIDFELDVIQNDEINVDYIFNQLDDFKKDIKENVFTLNVDKILSKIEKNSLRKKSELLEQFIIKWKERMLSNQENDWKDKKVSEAFAEFKVEILKNEIKHFCETNDLDYEAISEIAYNKSFEGKPYNAYRNAIINSIKVNVGLIEKNKIVKKTFDFLIRIENELFFDDVLKMDLDDIKN